MKAAFCALFFFAFTLLKAQQPQSGKAKKIDSFMCAINNQGQFMGAILVAENGRIIYKKGFGYADINSKEKFTTASPCYIGSLSKQFTALGIVQLKEKGKLLYSHSIRQYFPELPECYQPVTIEHMLHHTSGLALFDDYPNMTTNDVLNIIKQQSALRFTPGSRFEYCNANYSLLGMVIEKITNKSLDDYLTAAVFKPVYMKNTYVDEQGKKGRKRATGYYLFGDEYNYTTYIGGAAAVVSTVEDLYKWDQMLYQPTIISKGSLAEIHRPGTNEWISNSYGKQGYGFGWFISGDENNKIIQHDGGFAGFRSYIERDINKRNTIIFISNVRHALIGNIRENIVHILNNEPYTIPRTSAANWIMRKAATAGILKAIADYKALSSSKDSSQYYFSERECNSLGYYLIRNNRLNDAIALFTLNTEQFPCSGNVFDSLGEAYLKAGDKTKALASYKRSLELDPGNGNATNMIKKIAND